MSVATFFTTGKKFNASLSTSKQVFDTFQTKKSTIYLKSC